MPAPAFSVVVAAYNASATIGACLRSVQLQTRDDLEVIVVDDGSGDETAAIVAGEAATDRRIRLVSQANSGVSAARNAGVASARADLIGFLDSDDLWLPGYLEHAGRALAAAPDAGLAYADSRALLDSDKRVHRQTALEASAMSVGLDDPQRLLERLLEVNFITASAVTVRREVLDHVGAFAPELDTCEDWDLWLRIASAGYRLVRAGVKPLVLTRESATSASKNALAMARGACRAMERALAQQPQDSRSAAVAAEQLAGQQALARRLETRPDRSVFEAVIAVARPLRRTLSRRWNWRRPDPELSETLRRLGEL
jgi:glycosyltransferase involved in cell wall biosynthesis